MTLRPDVLEQPFSTLSIEETSSLLETSLERGLSTEEAAQRTHTFGPNLLETVSGNTWLTTLVAQFKSPLILLLVAATFVTAAIGDYQDALFILAAVLANAGLGFYQEHKAERALAELKSYLRQRARVIRSGQEQEIDATELVPGDLIRLSQGDRVPADARLVFVNDLQTDESMLTGEALPILKNTESVLAGADLGDQRSVLFAGTLVTQGVGTALVCRTGGSTELGRIATLVGRVQNEETPLQGALRKFSIQASFFLGALTLLIFTLGLLAGEPLTEMFLTAVAVAVSAVPEGLPVAMTVILAIGVQRMARRRGVVRKLAAAEALGSTNIILTDKTGTLTTARMEIGALIPEPGVSEEQLLTLALTNTSVLIENPQDAPAEWRMNGRIVEVSLVRSAALRGVDTTPASVLESLPFNALNKYSISLIEETNERTLVFVGAPDILLTHTTLEPEEREILRARIEQEAYGGGLVLGVATKKVLRDDAVSLKNFTPTGLSFVGLITLHDPIRPQVPAALKLVEDAGVRVVLITGDHRGTAESVARAVGMKVPEGSVLDAHELRTLSDEELRERLPLLSIVSRVSPLDKMRIVTAFQAQGLVVAMTGDGVNDAPSIKQADVGIAMGSGTAVTREVADLVLLDDNFETIAAAIDEGRQIRGNVRKVLVYLLSDSTDELFLIGGALLAGLAMPLTALQILWVNFFSDSFPAVAFAFEKEKDRRLSTSTRLFDPLMTFLILFVGVTTSALLFILYWYLLSQGYALELVQTFIFASFATYTILSALALRSLTQSVFSYSFFSNPAMLGGVGLGLVLTGIAIYVPFFQTLLDTVPLPLSWLVAVAGVALVNILAIELAKWLFRTFGLRRVYATSAL